MNPRDLGTISTALTQANDIAWYWFVRIDLPTGSQRFTDHALGDQTLNIDGAVKSFTITAPGSGYTSAPTVTISAPGSGVTATATATISGGTVTAITLTNPGKGYTSNPTVTLTGGGGSGATATASVTGTWTGSDGSDVQVDRLDQSQQSILSVSAISFANIGYQFTNWATTTWADGTTGLRGKTVQIWAGWFDVTGTTLQGGIKVYEGTIDNQSLGARAQLALKPYLTTWSRNPPWAIPSASCIFPYKDLTTCQYSGVGSVAITNGGTGYTSAPSVVFTGGGGSGAAGTAVLSGNTVGSVTITAGGSNYVTAPTISFSGGGGTLAAASAVIVGGVVVAINVTNAGSGYTTPPTVAFANNATGAAGTAILQGGVVVAVNMTAAGVNYGAVMPSVSFSGGGGANAAGTASSEISGESTCGKTRSSCTSRFNQSHFGGFDLMPKPGDSVRWGALTTTYQGTYGPFGTWTGMGGSGKRRIVRGR